MVYVESNSTVSSNSSDAQVTASKRGKNSPKLAKIGGDQLEKSYHAKSMSWLAGTAQRPVTGE